MGARGGVWMNYNFKIIPKVNIQIKRIMIALTAYAIIVVKWDDEG